MSVKGDQVKGHAKETAGIIAGDKELQARGRAERLAAESRAQVDQLTRTLEGWIDRVQEIVDSAFETSKGLLHRR